MKYTPTYQIPYLEGSDKLSALSAASEEQARGVEAALLSQSVPPAGSDLISLVTRMNALEDYLEGLVGEWQALPLNGGSGTIRIRREGVLWRIQFDVTFSSAVGANQTVLGFSSVPADARPSVIAPLSVTGGTTGTAVGSVSTNGEVSLRNAYSGSISRFAGAGVWPA